MKVIRGSTIALLLLAFALPAVAAAPIIIENPISTFPIPAAAGCGTFDVLLTPQVGKPNGGQIIAFANGNAVFAGPAFVTLTNVSTGKSINVNISGPAKQIFSTNTFTFVNLGLTLVIGNSPDNPPSLQGIALANGRLVQTFDISTFNRISVSFTGTAQNLCPLLQ